MNRSNGSDKLSLPMLILIAISHMLAMLMSFSLAASSMQVLALWLSIGLPAMNQRKAWCPKELS
jgi:predicted signal transduction protein with EAL and GGDEF domain